MTDMIEQLREDMQRAAANDDFELAARLRDRINLLRGGAESGDVATADTSGITRQKPGAMGLGTSRQSVSPPKGWKPPKKPDLMTKGHSRRRGDAAKS